MKLGTGTALCVLLMLAVKVYADISCVDDFVVDKRSVEDIQSDSAYNSRANYQNGVTSRCEGGVPGPVQNLSIISSEDTITVSWDPPEDVSCVDGYVLEYNGNNINLSTNYYQFSGNYCTEYIISVAAVGTNENGESTTGSFDTGLLRVQVSNLAITVVDSTTMNVTWSMQTNAMNCANEYRLIVWDQSGTSSDDRTTEEYYVISPIVGCMTYYVQVTPIYNQSVDGLSAQTNREAENIPTNPPRNATGYSLGTTWSNLIWSTDSYSTNMCTITELKVECEALRDENQEKDWIIWNVETSVNITDSTSRPNIATNITELSEFTNYTCYGTIVNDGGDSNRSDPVKFQTGEDVPSEPTNVVITNLTSTDFIVNWEEPLKVPGILQGYGISVIPTAALHYIPEDCETDLYPYYESTEAGTTDFYVDSLLPHYNYSVSVNASTRVGTGQQNTIAVYTLNGVPEKPRNLTYIYEVESGTTIYNATVTINWFLPCNSNGNIRGFNLFINGTPTYEGAEGTFDVVTVSPNIDISDTYYEYPIYNINASYEYTVLVLAVLDDDTEGEVENVTFISPDGYPGPPILNEATEVDAYSFLITWTEPEVKNGELQNYTVTVQSFGPLYLVPNSDSCEVDRQTYNFQVTPDTTSFNFSQAKPYYSYSFHVAASTSAGIGIISDVREVITPETVPEAPYFSDYDVTVDDYTNYNSYAVIDWGLPCQSNGQLSHFVVTVEGTSTYDSGTFYLSEDTEVNSDSITNYTKTIDGLNASYTYVIDITAVLTSGGQGENARMEFLTSDGYPGAPEVDEISTAYPYSFLINWLEPEVKNGALGNYSVTIESTGPLYLVPDTEGCEADLQTYEYYVAPDITSFNFTQALPYYNYTVYVEASTSIGYGARSNEQIVITPETAPEEPYFADYSVTVEDYTDYNSSAIINWGLPCKSNGALSHFIVTVEGTSTYDSGSYYLSENITVNEGSTDSYTKRITNLNAAYSYTINIAAVLTNENQSGNRSIGFNTSAGYPGAPILNEVTNIEDTTFVLTWQEPSVKNGELINYNLTIENHGPLYTIPEDDSCTENLPSFYYFTIPATQNSYTFDEAVAFHRYTAVINVATSLGYGANSETQSLDTQEAEPEQVRNMQYSVEQNDQTADYDANIGISFQAPCHTYGNLVNYTVTLIGVRNGLSNHSVVYTGQNMTYQTSLEPQRDYTLEIIVETQNFNSRPTSSTFLSPSGVPTRQTNNIETPTVNGTSTAIFEVPSDLFDTTNGYINYYAIIVGTPVNSENSTYGYWNASDASTWPSVVTASRVARFVNMVMRSTGPYQATPIYWNPFQDNASSYSFVLGSGECDEQFCNYALEADTEYTIKVRGFTSNAYRDSDILTFTTDQLSASKRTLIIAVVLGVLAAIVLIVFIVILLWRRKNRPIENRNRDFLFNNNIFKRSKKPEEHKEADVPPTRSLSNFPAHFKDISIHYNKLKAEYTLLGNKTSEVIKSKTTAELPENKGKNRYMNIMPFDDTRVILDTDKNENYSHYINASFIKGFSGETEYIATQGPLESTCLDFWRMVVQENVTVIAMVAQFVEQNKQKCYQYFPENRDTITIAEDIEIQCATELNFGAYTIRTLFVEKNSEKRTVTHYQFTEWPDFGCPTHTDSMLQFIQLMREQQKKDGGKILVHCSAGVGRTGTLIALDILLQNINAGKDIDVFDTVLNLRKQRPNMVQTEKQYMYIHRCLNDAIENPSKLEDIKMSDKHSSMLELIPDLTSETKKRSSDIQITEI